MIIFYLLSIIFVCSANQDIYDSSVSGGRRSIYDKQGFITQKPKFLDCIHGTIVPNEQDCTSYYECMGGRYHLRLCEYGTSFNPQTKCCESGYRCTTAEPLPIVQTETRCRYGEVRPDDDDCTKYYICAADGSRLERRSCPSGKRFDAKANGCIGEAYQQTKALDDFTEKCQESSGRDGYRADPNDCHRFYQCAQGKWVHKNCPSNLVWNSFSAVCDWPKSDGGC